MVVLWLWLWLVLGSTANAQACGDIAILENQAYRGRLDDAQKACLESMLLQAPAEERVKLSFLMILQAYIAGEAEAYPVLMRRHLSEVHTTDPEVAYLYASWLKKNEPDNHADRLHWTEVAFEGRFRWIDDRIGYTAIVKSLYDMLIETSLQRALELEGFAAQNPTDANLKRAETARRWARYYLIIAAPCLHNNDCGPKFEVEIEGETSCEDLEGLSAMARGRSLANEQIRCLRARWNRNGKPKILTILMDSADHEAEGSEWESLLAWHWDATGVEHPYLAARHASYLAAKGPDRAAEVMKWTDIALVDRVALVADGGDGLLGHVLALRATAAEQLVTAAEQNGGDAGPARALAQTALQQRQEWCRGNPRDCQTDN